MKRWFSRYVPTPVIAFGLTLALSPSPAQSAPPQGAEPSAEKKQPPAPAPAPEPQDDPWEERKARAREDVEYLEALHKAKLAECREAELRSAYVLALKTDIDRQKQKGYIATSMVRQSEVGIAENQAQLEMRRVELKDVEIRLARSRRRLKAIERSGAANEPETFQAEDRLHELEIKYERLRREFELAERTIATLRIEIDLMKNRPLSRP